MKLNKQIIIPLLSAVVIFVKEAFGYELPDGTSDLAADLILWVFTSAGIFIHPKTKESEPEENKEAYYH